MVNYRHLLGEAPNDARPHLSRILLSRNLKPVSADFVLQVFRNANVQATFQWVADFSERMAIGWLYTAIAILHTLDISLCYGVKYLVGRVYV
jgi:hypothetical protein